MTNRRKVIALVVFTFFYLGLILFLIINKKPQETRSRATAATTIAFSPATTQSTPLQKSVTDTIPLDVILTPGGSNNVTFVSLTVQFDPSKLTPDPTNPISVNMAVLPNILEGPVVTTDSIKVSMSIGSDPTKVITSATKIATVTFTATQSTTTGQPTKIYFGTTTEILSAGPFDQAAENVLLTTNPAYITISDGVNSMPTPSASSEPSAEPTITVTPTPTRSNPTATLTLTPTGSINTHAKVELTVFLHNIGLSGDNSNQTANSLSNKNPSHPEKPFTLSFYNANNQLTASVAGTVTYASASGNFIGKTDIPPSLVSGETYAVTLAIDRYLHKRYPALQTIQSGDTVLSAITLVAGDAIADNKLNIIDYNLIVDCYTDTRPAKNCNQTRALQADINDDSMVNEKDYNLFLRELAVQSGD